MSDKKMVDQEHLLFMLTTLKQYIPNKTSDLSNDAGFITKEDVPEGAAASSTTPKMDGDTAVVGTEKAFARGDHVHPKDSTKVDKVSGKGLSTNDFTDALKDKLDGIASGANKTTVDTAMSATSTNPVQNKVVNSALGNKVDKVSGKGLSTNDSTTAEKDKLGGVAEGANKTVVDSELSSTSANPVQNKVVNAALANKAGKTEASSTAAGLMSATDKSKLDGVAEGANKTVVDTALSETSTNPVQNKAVNSALGNKVDKVSGKGLSTNDFTSALKDKLDGIAAGANKTTVDTSLSATSTNPVQNKAVNSALGNKVDKVSGKGLSTNDFTTAEKNKLAAFSSASDYALKSDVTGLYRPKGSVATYDDLPTLTENEAGWVYDVLSDGMNWLWTGEKWDNLGAIFTIDLITNEDILAMFTDW